MCLTFPPLKDRHKPRADQVASEGQIRGGVDPARFELNWSELTAAKEANATEQEGLPF
jgi:hypothetical protein